MRYPPVFRVLPLDSEYARRWASVTDDEAHKTVREFAWVRRSQTVPGGRAADVAAGSPAVVTTRARTEVREGAVIRLGRFAASPEAPMVFRSRWRMVDA